MDAALAGGATLVSGSARGVDMATGVDGAAPAGGVGGGGVDSGGVDGGQRRRVTGVRVLGGDGIEQLLRCDRLLVALGPWSVLAGDCWYPVSFTPELPSVACCPYVVGLVAGDLGAMKHASR